MNTYGLREKSFNCSVMFLPLSSICKSPMHQQQDRHTHIHPKDGYVYSQYKRQPTVHKQHNLEFKCIHDAFYKCFPYETFISEASSALGSYQNHFKIEPLKFFSEIVIKSLLQARRLNLHMSCITLSQQLSSARFGCNVPKAC